MTRMSMAMISSAHHGLRSDDRVHDVPPTYLSSCSPFCAVAGPLTTTTSHTYPHTVPLLQLCDLHGACTSRRPPTPRLRVGRTPHPGHGRSAVDDQTSMKQQCFVDMSEV